MPGSSRKSTEVASQLSETAERLATASAAPVFESVRERLAALAVDDVQLLEIVRRVSHGPRDQDEFLRLRAQVTGVDGGGAAAPCERYALLRAALAMLEHVTSQPVPPRVQQLLLDEFVWLTQPADRELPWLVAGHYIFSALCKLVTLRRFPAGQFHWEVDGLPRSVLWRAGWRDLPQLLRALRSLGGFRPMLTPHLAWRRATIVLSEREHTRSLLLMAQALELQPAIRGFVAEGWFYAPDIARGSPHLAWAPRLFQEWGGTVLATRRAGAESGVFVGGRGRERLARAGRFQPRLGLVLWTRSEMLRWARLASASAT